MGENKSFPTTHHRPSSLSSLADRETMVRRSLHTEQMLNSHCSRPLVHSISRMPGGLTSMGCRSFKSNTVVKTIKSTVQTNEIFSGRISATSVVLYDIQQQKPIFTQRAGRTPGPSVSGYTESCQPSILPPPAMSESTHPQHCEPEQPKQTLSSLFCDNLNILASKCYLFHPYPLPQIFSNSTRMSYSKAYELSGTSLNELIRKDAVKMRLCSGGVAALGCGVGCHGVQVRALWHFLEQTV
jgi:hypothetical protein